MKSWQIRSLSSRPPEVARWPISWRYGLAVLSATAGLGIRYLLNPVLGLEAPLLFSLLAVTVAAWFGGQGPGLLAILLSFLGGIAVHLSPLGIHSSVDGVYLFRLIVFLSTGTILTLLTEAVRHATAQWRQAEQERENLILQERNRLAREIHDTLAQGFTGIIIQLEAAEDTLIEAPDETLRHLHRAQNLARESLSEARRSVQALRPQLLTQRDLAFALKHYIEQMTGGTGVQAALHVEGVPAEHLPPDLESDLLRIGLEALTNALKHANSRHIRLTLTFAAERVRLSVRDDGQGILPESVVPSSGYGLTAMRERAERSGGTFALNSWPGEGTEVIVDVPLRTASSLSDILNIPSGDLHEPASLHP